MADLEMSDECDVEVKSTKKHCSIPSTLPQSYQQELRFVIWSFFGFFD